VGPTAAQRHSGERIIRHEKQSIAVFGRCGGLSWGIKKLKERRKKSLSSERIIYLVETKWIDEAENLITKTFGGIAEQCLGAIESKFSNIADREIWN